MTEDRKKRLFVYGTLTNPANVRTIAGRTFPSRKAILEGYEKITSTTFFPYIVRRSGSLVQGQLLEGLDPETMSLFDDFEGEGDMYRREKVTVIVGGEPVKAYTYVGNKRNLLRYFERGVAVEDRIKDHLEDRMETMLQERLAADDSKHVFRRAKAELYGSTISDLVAAHFDHTGIPEYLVRKGLSDSVLPSLRFIASNEEAIPYADNYIRFAVRHIVFNQLEQRIRREFRGLVKAATAMYEYTISCLLALKHLNAHKKRLKNLLQREGAYAFDPGKEYIDYAMAGVRAADALYSRREIADLVIRILSHRQEGRTPLGAEIELSFLGVRAVHAKQGEDTNFDGFYFSNDFDLPKRCWKLGGYIDDHSLYSPLTRRTRGFFEYAFGRLNLQGNIAKPATQDPWILSELINEALRFAEIPPHSMHITLQPPQDTQYRLLEQPDFLVCLLMLGGDISQDDNGVLREKRIWQEEVIGENVELFFSKFNFHPSARAEEEQGMLRLVEYQFPRLRPESHEAFIMALKGFQLGYKPYPFISSPYGGVQKGYTEISEYLIRWAERPTPIPNSSVREFLRWMEMGLMAEDRGYPSHSRRFIEDCLAITEGKINDMNLLIAQSVITGLRIAGTRLRTIQRHRNTMPEDASDFPEE